RTPLADAIEGENRGLVEGAWKEGAGSVALVMIGEDHPAAKVSPQSLANEGRQARLLLQPHRHRHAETLEAGWRKRQVRLEQPLELSKWLFVEDDVVDVGDRFPRFLQAILHRVRWKARVVFLSREPLFLRGRNDLAIDHEA